MQKENQLGKIVSILCGIVAAVSLAFPYAGIKGTSYSDASLFDMESNNEIIVILAIAGIALVVIGALIDNKIMVIIGAIVMCVFLALFYKDYQDAFSTEWVSFKTGFILYVVGTVGSFIGGIVME